LCDKMTSCKTESGCPKRVNCWLSVNAWQTLWLLTVSQVLQFSVPFIICLEQEHEDDSVKTLKQFHVCACSHDKDN
jgi:hypothetical protein